jgi:hypothetical protein
MPRKPLSPSEPADYRRWRRHAERLLKDLGVPAGPWSREGDLRKMYIGGATPEQAAQEVQTHYWNTRSFERLRPKR